MWVTVGWDPQSIPRSLRGGGGSCMAIEWRAAEVGEMSSCDRVIVVDLGGWCP